MKPGYFADTDTICIEFSEAGVTETRELDENTLPDVDPGGHIVSITLEHASERTDVNKLVLTGIAA